MTRAAPCVVLLVALVGCGDDDDEETIPDEILPASTYASRCETPRSGIDPRTDAPYDDGRGSALQEKLWLRSWLDDLYLWYRELPAKDVQDFDTAIDYFDAMKTPARTASDKPKDQFHFTYDSAVWYALSESGIEASYGLQWVLVSRVPPRKLVVAYTLPGSPGAAAGVVRGAEVITIDGVDLANGTDVDTLNHGIAPEGLGEAHTFVLRDAPGAATRTVTLTSAEVAIAPVIASGPLPAPHDKVGYLAFTDHIATAEQALAEAVTRLRDAGVTELVLDLRYNGGGYLFIASELAYMIAGPDRTAGKVFERRVYNDKYTTFDPFYGTPIEPTAFFDKAAGFSLPLGQPLPTLNLGRVFVLTGPGTCSASEAVMNGLAGIDVEVIQIGGTTCGKPYGFFPADNCGTTYFAIQFEGVNDQGFGDYADGFAPGELLPGCEIDDDFTHALGDPAEALLAAALGYDAAPGCATARRARAAAPRSGGEVLKPLWRQNRIVTR